MKSGMLSALVGAFVMVGAVQASTVTVVGSMGGRIYYDGKDVGTIPLRLTKVPAGRHVVRVVTPTGVDRTFDLDYPRGKDVDRVVDMDVEVSRREPAVTTRPAPLAPEAPPVNNYDSASRWNPARQDDVRYEYVYPSDSDTYRNYDSRSYRSNYGSYPSGYNQPYYGGNYYGYGGYPGYYDTYGGLGNYFGGGFSSGFGRNSYNRDYNRDTSYGSRRSSSSAPSFSSGSSGFAATPPPFSSTPFTSSQPPPGIQGPVGTPTFRAPGTVVTGGTPPFRSSGQAGVAGQKRPEDQ